MSAVLAFFTFSGVDAQAAAYPFELPAEITATLNIDTSQKRPFNHLLIGLNCSWPEKLYGKVGFNHPDAQKLIRAFKPTSLRFPHGVWANFYDWESDGRRMTDHYKTSYEDAVRNHPDLKYGFAGFHTLHEELNFDVLFTWNVNYDSPEKGARRLVDLRDKGFHAKWIELGNEIFWKTQRSEAVSDLEKYIAVSKAHTAALKAVDPAVKVSVPVHWRDALTNEWNLPLMKQDYFDAISVHKYIIKQDSAKELGEALDARREMVEMGKTLSQAFGNRPLWVSEWSVNCGDDAISVLGMADTYLGFFAHPELFEVTSYFQMNAEHPLIEYDKKTGTHTRTILAAAYEVIRGVFEGSEHYASHIDSTKIGPDLDAVSAETVIKDGRVTVFAINKTNRPVPLSLSFDGKPDTRTYTHRALLLETPRSFDLSEDVFTDVPPGQEGIKLPPLSLNRIDLAGDAEVRGNKAITKEWLTEHLSKTSPRLILTPEIETELKEKLKSDPLLQGYFHYLQTEAAEILALPLAQHELVGFRMPGAFTMMKRLGILAMVYRLEPSAEVLERINDELLAVCAFADWNPQHFLDVSQMSLAVALAIDWTGEALPKETVRRAKAALIEKGILPSYNESGERMQWISGNNNWNSVCHGGMVAASLAIADVDPELAAKTISRALEKLPGSLKEYAPDGAHPEGPSYWRFGTSFSVLAANVLKTALGSDFGITASPGFMQSADFRLQTTAPSGDCFNFADCDSKPDGESSVLLAWFAAQTGDALYLDRTFFENPAKAERLAGPGLVWLSQFTEKKNSALPSTWCGKGNSPVAVFRGAKDAGGLYLAAKGGAAQVSHGNMDAGTFVFELDGVRWVVDPGNQDYEPLNKIGFPLSDYSQDSKRWGLLTKSNQGHSTVVVNGARFAVRAQATITDYKSGERPEATIDLSAALNGQVKSWQRRFVKDSERAILIQDQFETNDQTKEIVWQLITVADVEPTENGAILRQDGKKLRLTVLKPKAVNVSVVSLDPPPLEIDKTIQHLKRIEIRIPVSTLTQRNGLLEVRLSGQF